MHRKSMTALAAGALALSTAACSSGSSSTKTSSSPTSSAASSSSAATTSSSVAASSASSTAATTATGTAAHGGVTLGQSAPLASKQGTKPLVVENNPIPSLQANFNAFNSESFGYKLSVEGLVYEPLLQFNDLKPNFAYPWLATDFAWNTDGTAVTFTIRNGVKFSDGNPLTPADVAYTFQAMVDDPAANRLGIPIKSATVMGTDKVQVTFTAAQFQNIFNIAGQTFIVEKKAYSAQPKPSTFADPKPVGTGPYVLASAAAQGFTFKANPTYWGGKPPVPQVNAPSFSTGSVAEQQLGAGKIDYAGNFVSQIDKAFVAKNPTNHHYWFPAINVVNLVFNVNSGPAALKDPQVRKAISAAIDRTKVSTQAEQGYEPPATSSSGLLLPNFAALVPAGYKNDLKPGTDPAAVDSIMTAAGYKKNGQGYWAKNGTEVAFKIEDPTAYTDYYQAAQIMSADFQKLGFHATAVGVDPNKWYADLAGGTFDTAIHWSNIGPSPYATYDGWLDPALSKGNNASGNYGRYSNPAATAALAQYAKAGTAAQGQAAINALAKIMKDETPVAPMMYAAGWYEYNDKNYSGWVTKDNQYMDPSPNPSNVEYVVLHLTPKS